MLLLLIMTGTARIHAPLLGQAGEVLVARGVKAISGSGWARLAVRQGHEEGRSWGANGATSREQLPGPACQPPRQRPSKLANTSPGKGVAKSAGTLSLPLSRPNLMRRFGRCSRV